MLEVRGKVTSFQEEGEGVSSGRKGEDVPFLGGRGRRLFWKEGEWCPLSGRKGIEYKGNQYGKDTSRGRGKVISIREEGGGVSSRRKGEGVSFPGGRGKRLFWKEGEWCPLSGRRGNGYCVGHSCFWKVCLQHTMLLFIAVESCLLYKSLVPKDCFISSMMIIDGKRASYIQQYCDYEEEILYYMNQKP